MHKIIVKKLKPNAKHFSLTEMSSEPGVYATTHEDYKHLRFVCLRSGGVLQISLEAEVIDFISRDGWKDDFFVKVDEEITLTFSN